MNKPIETMYKAMCAKWEGPTVPWGQLHPQQQFMLIQAYNLIITVMDVNENPQSN